jgi:CRISPR/Cas system-associated exonuclease Cas4 (RecB family)
MSSFDFILDQLKFSHSSVSTFETCRYAFYLTYIQAEERKGNFYSAYGLFIHKILEKYFKGELEAKQLSGYYIKNYDKNVFLLPPVFRGDPSQAYYEKGLSYFENFSFDKSLYDIKLIEENLEFSLGKIKCVTKPDLLLQEKEGGKYILVDFKTANPYKKDKLDKSKMKGYLKQLYLYTYGLWLAKEIVVDEIHFWFVTCDKVEKIIVNPMDIQESLDWFDLEVHKINHEEDWLASVGNKFYCHHLCSMKDFCDRWEKGGL